MDVGSAKKLGNVSIRFINGFINLLVLIVIFLLFVFAAYAIWDSDQVFNEAEPKQFEIFKPSIDDSVSFEELQVINPEVFAWISVYGTNIDYPVVQSESILKYVTTNVYGDYSASGSIFLDSENNNNLQDFNNIIYGHHMEKDVMFGNIDLFKDKVFFDSHLYGNLFFDGKDHGLEFFAFVQTDAYDYSVYSVPMLGESAQQKYLDNIFEIALFSRDIDVSIDDRLVLLSTCSSVSTNARDILVARLTDEVFENSFIIDESSNEQTTVSVDEQHSFWENKPTWLLIILPIIIILIFVVIVIVYRFRKKNMQRSNRI